VRCVECASPGKVRTPDPAHIPFSNFPEYREPSANVSTPKPSRCASATNRGRYGTNKIVVSCAVGEGARESERERVVKHSSMCQ
jgi:hypothetical protein